MTDILLSVLQNLVFLFSSFLQTKHKMTDTIWLSFEASASTCYSQSEQSWKMDLPALRQSKTKVVQNKNYITSHLPSAFHPAKDNIFTVSKLCVDWIIMRSGMKQYQGKCGCMPFSKPCKYGISTYDD